MILVCQHYTCQPETTKILIFLDSDFHPRHGPAGSRHHNIMLEHLHLTHNMLHFT